MPNLISSKSLNKNPRFNPFLYPRIGGDIAATITDTRGSLTNTGTSASGKSISMTSGSDIVLQATRVTAGEGGINLDAGRDLKLITATDSKSSGHQETVKTSGMVFRADGSADDLSERDGNHKRDNQTGTAQVTSLVSAGNITTHSGRDTRIEGSTLDAVPSNCPKHLS
jgi:hypothetical protein